MRSKISFYLRKLGAAALFGLVGAASSEVGRLMIQKLFSGGAS